MPGIEYIPKLKEVEGVGGDSLTPSNMARRPLTIRLENIANCPNSWSLFEAAAAIFLV